MTRYMLMTLICLMASASIAIAGEKKIHVTGKVNCGQDTCSIGNLRDPNFSQFVVKTTAGQKILKAANQCSWGPLELTGMVDDKSEMITRVVSVKCAR